MEEIQWSAVTVTPSGIGKSVTVTDCHCNISYKMTHIEAKSITIWLRYDPKWNITSCLCGSKETRSDIRFWVTSQQILMDFASIWVILKVKFCWAALI